MSRWRFLTKIKERMQKPIVEINVINTGNKFRKINNLAELQIQAKVLAETQNCTPVHNPPCHRITIPAKFLDNLHQRDILHPTPDNDETHNAFTAYELLETDGTPSILLRGLTPSQTEVKASNG